MAMNLFRMIGDLSHVVATFLLLAMVWKGKSCDDVSGRAQILYLLVYVSRYLDLFAYFISVYNSALKVFYILITLVTVCSIHFKTYRSCGTVHQKKDTFRIEFLIVPAAILALLVNHQLAVMEVLWTFSIYLEAVAIVPQLYMIFTNGVLGDEPRIMVCYLVFLFSYRGNYISNWIYRYYTEGFYDIIAIVGGCIETAVFVPFFIWLRQSPRSPLNSNKDTTIATTGGKWDHNNLIAAMRRPLQGFSKSKSGDAAATTFESLDATKLLIPEDDVKISSVKEDKDDEIAVFPESKDLRDRNDAVIGLQKTSDDLESYLDTGVRSDSSTENI